MIAPLTTFPTARSSALRRGVSCALALCAGALGCSQGPGRPNVLLVSVDALRADHVGAYGYARSTTPFLDRLARDGQRFERTYVPLPATAPSHASLLTSLHPAQHGVVANTMTLPEQAETLAEVLKGHGYATLGAVAVFYLKARYGFGQGFDAFSDSWDPRAHGNSRERRSAEDVNASLATQLASYAKQKRGRPLFLFVHYYDVHAPYREGGRGGVVEAYDAGVRHVDEQLEALYARLKELGLADDL